MGERETWTTDEFGSSHEGAVGVVLGDGTVPGPVYFDSASGACGQSVAHWYVYDGSRPGRPCAAALRAVCSCGWTGGQHPLDWDMIRDDDLEVGGDSQADACVRDWDAHTVAVDAQAVALPEAVTSLLEQLEAEIDKLTGSSPVAGVRAARKLEVLAGQVGYWAARGTRTTSDLGQTAAALGLDEAAARRLLARLGRWNRFA